MNPFQYGGVVTGKSFCNREPEQRDLRAAIDNHEKLFIYSERRLGKTSLVFHVLNNLPKRKYQWIYIDLWPTDSISSFITVFAKAVAESTGTTVQTVLETAKWLFSSLAPSVTVDDEGKATLMLGVKRPTMREPELREVLESPRKLARRSQKAICIVFDEFQQILEYENDLVERQLRAVIQHHTQLAYLFMGSRKHLIQHMFLNKSRPLYRSAGHYPLLPIAVEKWKPFIQKRFRQYDKGIDAKIIEKLCCLTKGHPFYTQHLSHVLWERCESGQNVNAGSLEDAVEILLKRESYAYTSLWESLTANQRRFLKGIALNNPGTKPFSSEFLLTFDLKSASSAQSAAESLLEKDIIDRDNGSFSISDRFFAIWIIRNSSITQP